MGTFSKSACFWTTISLLSRQSFAQKHPGLVLLWFETLLIWFGTLLVCWGGRVRQMRAKVWTENRPTEAACSILIITDGRGEKNKFKIKRIIAQYLCKDNEIAFLRGKKTSWDHLDIGQHSKPQIEQPRSRVKNKYVGDWTGSGLVSANWRKRKRIIISFAFRS